ncbi:MAG: winged helix-turn-helix transcriptional regulator [Enterococcus sp.]|nr:winged helix-turn-helix transcriptional regulator [Enterococcus sp.]
MRIRRQNDNLNDKEVELISAVSDALAHPVRLEIFRFIMSENKSGRVPCAKDIVGFFDYSQSTISQHLKKLTDTGLVELKKKGTFTYYAVHTGIYQQYYNAIGKFLINV